jgi:hypothetical protein
MSAYALRQVERAYRSTAPSDHDRHYSLSRRSRRLPLQHFDGFDIIWVDVGETAGSFSARIELPRRHTLPVAALGIDT